MFAHGALDFAFIGHLEKALDAALGDDPPRIWLDLTDVWLMDASVLRILLAFQRRAAAAGCTFRVVGATGIVRRVFEITDTLQSLSD